MKLWKKIKTSLVTVVCNEDKNGNDHEGWESYYSNHAERRDKRIRESHR